ncbi:hypothetical protein FHS76_001086 [Ochrobactrum daejeonense]|uniref:SnoaL-like domain-containing protein n=1 Tax=Brucella daejeonensis TaxID=659015 RepID=A0A7W9AVA3_9HYPH|nr:nuclear transport factor 2 family protein [Brucella daejeonensis]MBB5701237.1 hypothetical protein [Brucella daejeonensis]
MKPTTIIDKILTAVNSGAADKFLNLFTKDGEVDDWGLIYRGREEIKTWSDRELFGARARLTLRLADVHKGGACMIVHIGNAGFRGCSRFTITLENCRIRYMKITPV